MAFAVLWTISCISAILIELTLIGCHGLTIDQVILQAMNKGFPKDEEGREVKKFASLSGRKGENHHDKNVVTIEYDMLFKPEDLVRLNKERIPFEADKDVSEEPPRRRRDALRARVRQRRNAIRDLTLRWTNNVIPYTIQPGAFSGADMRQINAAMDDFNRYTCLRFVRRTNQKNYTRFQNGQGCSSAIGMFGGEQYITLESACRTKPSITHEIGHAAGLYHEHNRPDRDTYVRILSENLPGGRPFVKFGEHVINTYGVPYDYASVMHYGQYAFSKNGKRTIVTLDPSKQNVIGKSKGLSFRDVKILNLMYNCKPSSCSNKKCSGEGFVGKDCKCYCPGSPVKECCKDLYQSCEHWAQVGYCKGFYGSFMNKNCAKACKFCQV